ncbi:serine/threonine-protein kinase [Oceanicoccus sp. KOV_DT_Chl]|uniref:serine/threonine protein kinase n=1 Tax=Oceanicoccus sp. KOV_DT_Chl TaxID=1904639 RepID=UPI00135B7112|nr:serine/threonine-protein kinase [Oceanicoccus sp. KOV_DT_Chl]
MTKDSETDPSAVTRIRSGAKGAAEEVEVDEGSHSAPTNIRSHYHEEDDDEGDKTVVVGVGITSSNDATVVLGTNDAAKTGAPTLTLGNTKIINDRFELLDVLGSGGMGVVFKAMDRRKVEAKDRDPYVAIKLLNDDFKVHPHSVISLQREARRSQQLAHPNIVNVHDFDRDGDQVFMTMEYLQGKPLDELIKENGRKPLPDADAHRILKDMCSAMIHAHKNNIAHSDFKPGNIFVTNAGQAKVLDFGIARAVTTGVADEDGHNENTLFDPGSLGP